MHFKSFAELSPWLPGHPGTSVLSAVFQFLFSPGVKELSVLSGVNLGLAGTKKKKKKVLFTFSGKCKQHHTQLALPVSVTAEKAAVHIWISPLEQHEK